MGSNVASKFELHKRWVETIGEEGDQLNLDEVDFRNIDCSKSLLEQSYLTGCIFDGLNLKNVDFHGSVLCSSTYKKTNLDSCDFYKSDLGYTNFSYAILKNVNFSKSDFWEALFNNANLTECNLSDTNFSSTDFSNVRLSNVDISLSRFENTLFSGATLENIKGIEEAFFHSINIGTLEQPILLEREQAKKWVIENCL
ncbi:Pentapeptide repeat-containing protein [Bacillus sp. 491mf]|uniref:pentapeptide repeat-containing protein n=1 Tax=unclassified Bacillus (in: firmicutes) TaxID=185979 RepID=UPI000554445A|nr:MULTISPECIES: pentapeptide repeat-containing protein [unclassified Bacillus (in: firmicutes)]SFC83179.1 Pentapeptide repeat-containing protein [Bacillus sp. 491mf]